ncbi:MAG: sialidase family protein [Caldilineaceae bacterium]
MQSQALTPIFLLRTALLILLTGLFLGGMSLTSLAWSPASQITHSAVDSLHPSAVVDADGRVHVVWYEANGANGSGEIFYTSSNDDGQWSTPIRLSQHVNAMGSALVELALTPANELMALWIESDFVHTSKLYYAYKKLTDSASAAWSTPVALTADRLVGLPAMTVNGGTLYAVWPTTTDADDYADTIMLSIWRTTTWSTPQPLPLATGTFDTVRLAFDAQGRLHLIWNGNLSGEPANLRQYQILYSVYNGTTWSEPVNISQSATYSFWPSLAVDAAGNVHIIWLESLIALEQGAPIFEDVYYQRLTVDGWLEDPVKLSTSMGAIFPTAHADTQGRVHFTWSENTSTDPATFHFRVRYTAWDGESLRPPIQISGAFPQNGHVTMDLASATTGDLWLVWTGGDERGVAQLFASKRDAAQLSHIELGFLTEQPDIAGHGAEQLHAVWTEGIGESYTVYSHWQGNGWSNPQRITPVGLNSRYSALAVDSQNRPHVVAYAAQETGNYIYYTYADASGWISPTIVSQLPPDNPPLASTPHLALDSQDRVHVVWQALPDFVTDDFAIYYRRRDGAQWSAIERLSPPDQGYNAPRIAVDLAGHPHVVWYAVAEQEIYYTSNNGSGWSTPVNISQTALPVSKPAILSQGPDMAIDRAGNIHVGWLESTNGSYFDAVYYATNQHGAWYVQPVMAKPTPVRDMQRQSPTVVDILAGGSGQVHLLWHDVDQSGRPTVYHSRKSADHWSSPTILLTDYQNAHNPSGYLDTEERLHLLWSDLQTTREIFYQRIDHFNWIKVVDAAGAPVAASQIYRNGAWVGATDQRGVYLPTAIANGDRFAALAPVYEFPGSRDYHTSPDPSERQWAYRVYLTNWTTTETPTVNQVTDPHQEQLLQVNPTAPLILFNLVVSLEWRATPAYLATIQSAMHHASNYLYDLTDGQMAFGHVAIYDGGQAWANADIQIAAKNNVRPYSYIGGIRATDRTPMMRLGRHWDGQSGAVGEWDAVNGYRTLVHEFGHYALNLYDEYFGYVFDRHGNLLGEARSYCIGIENRHPANFDQYGSAMDHQYTTSELSALGVPGLWSDRCEETRQWQVRGQSTWETLADFYADTATPSRWRMVTPMERGVIMPGPTQLPDFLPALPVVEVHATDLARPSQVYTVTVYSGAELKPRMRVLLYASLNGRTVALDQGLTDQSGRLTVYGATPGDTLQATSLSGGLTGSVKVGTQAMVDLPVRSPGDNRVRSEEAVPAPYLEVTAEPGSAANQVDLQLALHHVAADAEITLLVTAPGAETALTPALSYSPLLDGYESTVAFSTVQYGTGNIRVVGITAGQVLNLATEYELRPVANAVEQDIFAHDGNLSLHLQAESLPSDEALLVVSPLVAAPGPLPIGHILLGNPYRIAASGAVITLAKPILFKFHLPATVDFAQDTLALYWWNVNSDEWQVIASKYDLAQNAFLALTADLGTYALMASNRTVEGDLLYLPFITK